MPSTSDELRKKFNFGNNTDGIPESTSLIEQFGGRVYNFVIKYNGENKDVLDAIRFLCEEWDYAFYDKETQLYLNKKFDYNGKCDGIDNAKQTLTKNDSYFEGDKYFYFGELSHEQKEALLFLNLEWNYNFTAIQR